VRILNSLVFSFRTTVRAYTMEFAKVLRGSSAQAKDPCVLTGERLRECRAVREVPMQNLFELEMPTFLGPIAVTRLDEHH
jgi:hypothetical protein